MSALRAFGEPLAAIAAASGVAFVLLWALGADPVAASGALVQGAFGDRVAVENTLVRMGPLALVGLAIALAFRCGIWNIGGEGQLYMGALAATALATRVV